MNLIAFENKLPPVDQLLLVYYTSTDTFDPASTPDFDPAVDNLDAPQEVVFIHYELCFLRPETFGFALYRQDATDGYGKKLPAWEQKAIKENGFWITIRDFTLDAIASGAIMQFPVSYINGDGGSQVFARLDLASERIAP